MPRRRTTEPVVIPSNSLVAASSRYSGQAARVYVPNQNWQTECYRHYLICGEARFAAKFFGHAVSRAVLGLANTQGDPVTSGPGFDAFNNLFSGADGQKQMLDSIGIHLTVVGECYLVGRTQDKAEIWEVLSILEVKTRGNVWFIDYGDGNQIDLTESDVVIRIWLPNPSKHVEADSPFRSLLPILREIEWLTRHVFAQISSRLAGAGILFLPQGVTFPPPPGQDGRQEPANEAEAFMQALGDAMMDPIEDPGSPAAVIPNVVMIPGSEIDKPRLMHFWSELDAASKEMRAEAIRRFALGMDLPPEQILGISGKGTGGGTSTGTSHWGAWQIEEATIKMHIEPMLDMIVNTLTISYLRPLDEGTADQITYNTNALRLRPDRSKESFELWDRGQLKTVILLRENGFSEEDLPDPEEFKRWLLVKIASGSATPEQVQAALAALGVPLATGVATQGPVRETPPAPSIVDHPTKRMPEAAALLAASEALVFRALERAGNRLRQAGVKPPGVPAYETHVYVQANGSTTHLLDDAWSCAPQILEGIADSETIVPVLDNYCRALFAEGSAHSRERLREWLTLADEVTV